MLIMTTHYQNHTSPPTQDSVEQLKLKIDDHHVHCLKGGSGPPILLIHGGASDSQDWAATIDALAHSYTLYAPDMIGYGLSERKKDGYCLSDFVKSTQTLIHKLNLNSLVLVGHSLGGRVCLEIALRYPDMVTGLVLVDSVGFAKLAWWGTVLSTTAWCVRKVLKRPQPYPKFLIEDGEDKDWQCTDRLPSLKVPTLVVWNRRDPYFEMAGALKASQLIPEVNLQVYPRFGHAPHKQDRDSFNNLLLGFLKQG